MEIKDGKDYIPQVRELIVLKIIEYDKSEYNSIAILILSTMRNPLPFFLR